MHKTPQVSKTLPLFQLMAPKGQTVLSRVAWKAGWRDEGMRVKGKLSSFDYQGIYWIKEGRVDL